MGKRVIVHHAHHADEGKSGIYRLIFAEQLERVVQEVVEDSFTSKTVERTEIVYVGHQEVVWDAGDPKWANREPEDIAAEQRQIVSDVITKQVAEDERAAVERAEATSDLGGIGTEL